MKLKVANMVLTGKLSIPVPPFDKILETSNYQCHYDERYAAGIGMYIKNGHVSLFRNGTVVVKGVVEEAQAQNIVKILITELKRISNL